MQDINATKPIQNQINNKQSTCSFQQQHNKQITWEYSKSKSKQSLLVCLLAFFPKDFHYFVSIFSHSYFACSFEFSIQNSIFLTIVIFFYFCMRTISIFAITDHCYNTYNHLSKAVANCMPPTAYSAHKHTRPNIL